MSKSDFAIKDDRGMYVSGISYDKPSKQYVYSCSKYLTNGPYTYGSNERAQEELDRLFELATEIGFERDFHIEKIDMLKVMLDESKLSVPKFPFIWQYIPNKLLNQNKVS